jgi:hypothetical protein
MEIFANQDFWIGLLKDRWIKIFFPATSGRVAMAAAVARPSAAHAVLYRSGAAGRFRISPQFVAATLLALLTHLTTS